MGLKVQYSRAQTKILNRLATSKGADIASANNIALGGDGNVYDITGTTAVMRIDPTNVQAGTQIVLQFDSALVLHHNEGTDTATAKSFALTGAADYTTVAGDVIGFYYDGALWQEMFRNNTGDNTWGDGQDIVLGTTTGTSIGTGATQKLGFYGTTPVVQYATEGTVTGFTAGSGTAAKDDSTYTGDFGTRAYTVGDIVKCLKTCGLMDKDD
jgi:hypothetical protein